MGLRRTRTTTILKQLKEENPDISLEIRSISTIEIKNYIDNMINKGYKKFLFDEIQVRDDWSILIKDLFDEYVYIKKIKIIFTGSSSLTSFIPRLNSTS